LDTNDLLYNVLPDTLWSDWNVAYEQDLDNILTDKYLMDGENFNINEFLREGNFDDSFICWPMYELFSMTSNILSWYDILKINEIWVEVKVTYQHFIENIGKGVFWDEGFQSLSDNEAENIRQEYMSRIDKKRSGLPVNIFVDEMDCWEKIGPFRRIKFQGNKNEEINWKELYSMSIEKIPRVVVKDAQIDLTEKELQQIKDFVSENRSLLINMAKGNISLTDFFEKLGWITRRRNK